MSAASSPASGRSPIWSVTASGSTGRRLPWACSNTPSGLRRFRHGRPLRQRGTDRGTVLARVAGGEASGVYRPVALTKWCPTPGSMTVEVVRGGRAQLAATWRRDDRSPPIALVELRASCLSRRVEGVDKLRREGLIRHLGVTNFGTAHLRVVVSTASISSPTRSAFRFSTAGAGETSVFCLEHGVRLLAYGTLAGGFLSERWLGRPEPAGDEINDWSEMKYKRFVDAAGGWPALQAILRRSTASRAARAFRSPTSRRAGRSNSRRSPR